MPRRATPAPRPTAPAARRGAPFGAVALAAVVVLLLFQVLFYTAVLLNSGVARWFVPTIALSTDPALGEPLAERLAHVERLPQRLPAALTAAFLVGTALAVGDFLRRLFLGPSVALGRLERALVAFGLGMGATSLAIQLGGLAGMLTSARVGLAGGAAMAAWVVVNRRRPSVARGESIGDAPPAWLPGVCLLAMTPFAALSFLGACLPTTDYDAVAYHLLGPKEWYVAGR
ncbi:MAG: hypothetical protein ACRC1K_15565, partial [Planctomycetia bacterium]